LRRIVGNVLEAASAVGREGIEALSVGSLALFNQTDVPTRLADARPLAFDCIPAVGAVEEGGSTAREADVARGLQRLLGAEIAVAASVVQVPAFVGQASLLAIETERPLEPKEAEDLLSRAPRVELWGENLEGPNLRAAAGRDVVIVGRVRKDASVAHGLQLWMVTDLLRLAAANAVELAAARLQLH
jgi:aspartate-semialdehyde dehydrogenase